jgi:hypothetical protein
MRRYLAGLALAGLLVACGQSTSEAPAAQSEASGGYAVADQAAGRVDEERAPAAAPAPPPPADADAQTANQPAPQQGGGTNSPILYLAYTYGMGLEVPSERVAGIMDRHVQACVAAGPRLCQLITSSRTGDPESSMQGMIDLRAEPAWLRTFMGGIGAQVDEAGGRITSQNTNAEDLTRQIVDTEAHLRAQTTLRDRLQELLRTSRGRLSDLLEVERELARVQGEIDSVQSNLAVMRTRVSMSELTIQYQSAPRSVGSDTFEPLRNAFANFLGIVVGGFAFIITLIAGIIPLAVVIVPIVWAILAWRRRRGGKLFNRAPKAEPPTET